MRFRRHLFVCTQQRGGGGKPACGDRGGRDVVTAVEAALLGRGAAEVGVTATACLGPCFDGPSAVVYPEGVWYTGLTAGDAAALVAHLVDGEVIRDKVYEWADDARDERDRDDGPDA